MDIRESKGEKQEEEKRRRKRRQENAPHRDEHGLAAKGHRLSERRVNARKVRISVRNRDRVPPVGAEARRHIFGERQRRVAVDRDLVVVVDPDQIVERQMPGERRGLGADALLQAAVAVEGPHLVGDHGKAGAVELGREVALGDGEADAVGDALAERASGDLDALEARWSDEGGQEA